MQSIVSYNADPVMGFAENFPAGCNCAPEIEDAFLGWIMRSPDAVARFLFLPTQAFFQPIARDVWQLMTQGCIDLSSLISAMPVKQHEYVLRIAQVTLFGVDLHGWAKKIIDLYSQREMYRVAQEAISLSQRKNGIDPPTAIQQVIASLNAIATLTTGEETLKSHAQAAENLLNEIAIAHESEQSSRYLWGWNALDELTGGLTPGQLITIGARSSMGKSTFALNAAENMARAGIPTLFISLEMTASELETKIFSRAARVHSGAFRDPRDMPEIIYSKLVDFATRSSDMPLYLDDGNFCNAGDIEAAILRVQNRYGIKPSVVYVDYLQLMSLDDGGSRNMTQAISLLTRSLKQLAKKLGVVIVILSQLSRGVESKSDKRPMMSDLRDSGSIEQDSNMVLMLYRDAYYNPGSEMGDTTEVLVVKNRGGATGKVELVFDGKHSEFKGKL
jgi:replicative DNA helicase